MSSLNFKLDRFERHEKRKRILGVLIPAVAKSAVFLLFLIQPLGMKGEVFGTSKGIIEQPSDTGAGWLLMVELDSGEDIIVNFPSLSEYKNEARVKILVTKPLVCCVANYKFIGFQ